MTRKQAFWYEYRRQRFIGTGVIRAVFIALEWAFSPLPF